eukprot:361103-Chlamydomonas_euryale.AAC.3
MLAPSLKRTSVGSAARPTLARRRCLRCLRCRCCRRRRPMPSQGQTHPRQRRAGCGAVAGRASIRPLHTT